MLVIAGSVLVTSLIGSPHCAAMCGGFVGLYTSRGGSWLAHVAYNAGRLASYLALGVAAGLAGAGVERLGGLAGVSRAAAILAGTLMMAWGGASLRRALSPHAFPLPHPVPRLLSTLHRVGATVLRGVDREPAEVRAVTIGLLSTLLPCGWLYAFVAVAAGTGTPVGGATVMLAFWVGTLPMMTGLAVIARAGLSRFGRRMPVVSAFVLIAIGLLTLAGRMHPGVHAGHAAGAHPTHAEHADHGAR